MKKFVSFSVPACFPAAVMILFSALELAGCAHSIHLVHASDYTPAAPNTGRPVSVAAEQFVILGIKGDTDYVNQAFADLKSKCEGGVISGITTQFSTSLGFFSWTNKILMQGTCIKDS